MSSTLDPSKLYDTIYHQIGRLMDTSQFFIALHLDDGPIMLVPYLREYGKMMIDQEVAYGDNVTTLIVDAGTPFLFRNTEEYDEFERSHGLTPGLVGDEDSASGIFVPLNTGSRTIGALTVQSSRENAYTEEDVQTLSVIASQAAVAIVNAQLYEQSRQSVRQTQALLRVARSINSHLDLSDVLDALLTGMADVLPFSSAEVLLPDHAQRRLEVVGSAGRLTELRRGHIHVPFGEGVIGRVFVTGLHVIVGDTHGYPEWIAGGSEARSELAAPLLRGADVIGVINLERREINGFSADDARVLTLFASQASIAIENARLYAQQRQRVYELQTIQAIVQNMMPLHDMRAVAELIDRELRALIDYTTCRMFLCESDGRLVPICDLADRIEESVPNFGDAITRWIAERREPVLIGDTGRDSRMGPMPDHTVAHSLVGAPLVHHGETQGVMILTKSGANQFDENSLRLLKIVAAQSAIAFDRMRLYQRLRTEAVTDELTQLHNRRSLIDRFAGERSRALRNEHNLAVLMIDIDRFKLVNDSHGHDAGDVVLRELARIIRAVMRAEDVVARYGGEEFCVLIPEVESQEVSHIAQRLRRVIEQHRFPPTAGVKGITVSVGVALLEPSDQNGEVFSRADLAMYAAKRAGGNRVSWDAGDRSSASGVSPERLDNFGTFD